jgi:hypothetical protein
MSVARQTTSCEVQESRLRKLMKLEKPVSKDSAVVIVGLFQGDPKNRPSYCFS